ncbi:hypothetical protein [Psychrobacter sp.]|uniref:hypothetical protein n=1 Tax=Psychrobacter sp. TaxID=56811 RepID=UPI003C726D30
MNYQPFLEMNLLVSDELVSVFHQLLPSVILFLVATFYLLMFLHISLFSLWKFLGQPPKKRPYMIELSNE